MQTGEVVIRRAEERDIPQIGALLYQVHRVHSDARPDLFKKGARKYDEKALKKILHDDGSPVFVYDAGERIAGYAFCVFRQFPPESSMTDVKSLYIDDLCVDEAFRGRHIGTELYRHVLAFAKESGCYNVTLNVWADNTSAVRFYESIGMRVQRIGMEQIL